MEEDRAERTVEKWNWSPVQIEPAVHPTTGLLNLLVGEPVHSVHCLSQSELRFLLLNNKIV